MKKITNIHLDNNNNFEGDLDGRKICAHCFVSGSNRVNIAEEVVFDNYEFEYESLEIAMGGINYNLLKIALLRKYILQKRVEEKKQLNLLIENYKNSIVKKHFEMLKTELADIAVVSITPLDVFVDKKQLRHPIITMKYKDIEGHFKLSTKRNYSLNIDYIVLTNPKGDENFPRKTSGIIEIVKKFRKEFIKNIEIKELKMAETKADFPNRSLTFSPDFNSVFSIDGKRISKRDGYYNFIGFKMTAKQIERCFALFDEIKAENE